MNVIERLGKEMRETISQERVKLEAEVIENIERYIPIGEQLVHLLPTEEEVWISHDKEKGVQVSVRQSRHSEHIRLIPYGEYDSPLADREQFGIEVLSQLLQDEED